MCIADAAFDLQTTPQLQILKKAGMPSRKKTQWKWFAKVNRMVPNHFCADREEILQYNWEAILEAYTLGPEDYVIPPHI